MKSLKDFYLILIFIFLPACGPSSCFPNLKELKDRYPHVRYQGQHQPIEVEIKKIPPSMWAPLRSISKVLQGAIIVSEDWAFFSHQGYDSKQIQEAIHESIEEGRLSRGASTITQQLVKNVYLSNERSLIRKVRELWLATKVEKVLSKRRILELYLNIIELGPGIYGVGQASRHYFSKHPSEITAKEAAFLAMLLPSPKKYSISFRNKALTPFARKTIRSILLKMQQAGMISSEERLKALETPLSFEKLPVPMKEVQPEDESSSDEDALDDDSNQKSEQKSDESAVD